MNKERTVDRPRDCRDHNYDHISVPDGDTDSHINTYFGARMALPEGKAYIRSTINNEAAAWARYEGNYKSETRALREHDKNTDQRENIRELGIVTRSERVF